jgi:hypothetical protein
MREKLLVEPLSAVKAPAFAPADRDPISGVHLDLTHDETAALTQELHDIVDSDQYQFSARIRTLGAILAKLRPEPACEPLTPPNAYAPPRATAAR